MKMHNRKIKSLLALTLLVSACGAEQFFYVTSHNPDGIHKVNASGAVVWNYTEIRHPQTLDIDPEGNIFCSEIPGAKMISKDGKLLWRYDVPKGTQNPIARILGDGRYLVGNEGPGILLEIDSLGETLVKVQLSPINKKSHGQFRFCKKTAEGTYLAPMTADGFVHELSAEGIIINEWGPFSQPVGAARLPNGNTLIGSLHRLDEFTTDGELVWTFEPVQDGNLKPGGRGHVCEIHPLDNGNIAFTFYHENPKWPDIMVVNKDRKVITSITLPEINKVAGLKVVDQSSR